jgi:hypothetical protein
MDNKTAIRIVDFEKEEVFMRRNPIIRIITKPDDNYIKMGLQIRCDEDEEKIGEDVKAGGVRLWL